MAGEVGDVLGLGAEESAGAYLRIGGGLRVLVERGATGGASGGVEQFATALLRQFKRLELEETTEGARIEVTGLDAFAGKDGDVRPGTVKEQVGLALSLRRGARMLPSPIQELLRYGRLPARLRLPKESVEVRSISPDVVHFTRQCGFRTDRPTIFHPHDLQHLHLKRMFSAHERLRREVIYRALCARARYVPVSSFWTKRDLETRYGLCKERVVVIPLGPPLDNLGREGSEGAEAVGLELASPVLLYPAAVWPHKNHRTLLHAVAELRGRYQWGGTLVCTGALTPFFDEIVRPLVEKLGLASAVRFPGFVSDEQLRWLYRRAAVVVVPSLFESSSFPVMEAFAAGRPVVASDRTALPEVVGEAGRVVEAEDPAAWAEELRRVLEDEELRQKLVAEGSRRLRGYSWRQSALAFRALYRRAAEQEVPDDERAAVESWNAAW